MSCGRRDALPSVRFSNIYNYTERAFAVPFFISTTTRVRSIFWWPEPGDLYYTEQTLPLTKAWFPGIDVTPYRTPWEPGSYPRIAGEPTPLQRPQDAVNSCHGNT